AGGAGGEGGVGGPEGGGGGGAAAPAEKLAGVVVVKGGMGVCGRVRGAGGHTTTPAEAGARPLGPAAAALVRVRIAGGSSVQERDSSFLPRPQRATSIWWMPWFPRSPLP